MNKVIQSEMCGGRVIWTINVSLSGILCNRNELDKRLFLLLLWNIIANLNCTSERINRSRWNKKESGSTAVAYVTFWYNKWPEKHTTKQYVVWIFNELLCSFSIFHRRQIINSGRHLLKETSNIKWLVTTS